MSPSCLEVIDLADSFSAESIGDALAQLWTARGCQLEPVSEVYLCPLSRQPVTHPVMLSDGTIYEEGDVVKWLTSSACAPDTHEEFEHRKFLRLASLRAAIEQFLISSNVGYLPSEQLEQAMGEAEMPGTVWCRRIDGLDDCITQSSKEMESIQARLVESSELLERLRTEHRTKQQESALCLQSAFRSFLLRRRKVDQNHKYVMAAVCVQRWWRGVQKPSQKKAKKKRLRPQKKSVLAAAESQSTRSATSDDAQSQSNAPFEGRFVADGPCSISAALIKAKFQHVIQQFVKVEEKDTRSVLCFFLNQLGYDNKQHRVVIFTKTEQRAAGLKSVLQMSPSVDFPLLLITEADEEFVRFKALPNSVGVMPICAFERNVDISHASMIIHFDMPKDSDEYFRRMSRAGVGASVLSLLVTSEELNIIRDAEQLCDGKFRDIQGLAAIKISENKKALKRRLTAAGSRREKLP